jgi:hypothetical protein
VHHYASNARFSGAATSGVNFCIAMHSTGAAASLGLSRIQLKTFATPTSQNYLRSMS